ncbi:MAG: ankyrin repeat domain-containing protein [Pseudomonadota bacterium]
MKKLLIFDIVRAAPCPRSSIQHLEKRWVKIWGRVAVATMVLVALPCFARPLSNVEMALLRERSPAAADLAARLGRENNDDAIPFLIDLKDPALLGQFSLGFTKSATPAIEQYAIRFCGDREIGRQVLGLVRNYRSRALFDALLADIRLGIESTRAGRPGLYPNQMPELYAIARTELPGIEAELATLLSQVSHPILARAIAKLLVKRHYLPAEAAIVDWLRRALPGHELGDTAWLVSGFETQTSLDALTTRLLELRGTPASPPLNGADPLAGVGLREANDDLSSLVGAMRVASPANKLDRSRFTSEVMAEFNPKLRVQVQNMLDEREKEERAAAEINPTNFSRWARADNRIAQLKDFIARGAPLKGIDPSGDTPLMAAVRSTNAEAVRLLLAAGSNPDARDRQGLTPLHVLARYGGAEHQAQLASARLLVAAKANVSLRDAEGKTPLHDAVSRKFGSLTRILVDSGADVNAEASEQDLAGLRPLQIALDTADSDTATLLRDHGARVNYLFFAKRAALMGAFRLVAPFLGSH